MALNLADFGSLLTLFVGTICGSAAAYGKGAGWLTPLFAVLSFVIALVVAAGCSWCAYGALKVGSSGPDPRYSTKTAMAGCLYMLMPLVSSVTAGGAAVLLTERVLALFS
jgi:hypothetical protein